MGDLIERLRSDGADCTQEDCERAADELERIDKATNDWWRGGETLLNRIERIVAEFAEIERKDKVIEELKASRKADCVDFFRWFWNAPGTNAEQGYDTWIEHDKEG